MIIESHCDFLNRNFNEPCWGEIHLVKHIILETAEFISDYSIWCCEGHRGCFDSRKRYIKEYDNDKV